MFISKKEEVYIATSSDGTQRWFKNNKLHRDTDPAIIYANGTKVWYKKGDRHRLDGPAVENRDGTKYWYYEGKELNVSSQEEFERLIELKLFW